MINFYINLIKRILGVVLNMFSIFNINDIFIV